MAVLVARFAGANQPDKVNRVVYQAFLTAVGISLLVMAPVGWFASPVLLDLVNAAPEVKSEALPFLRIMFLFSIGMMVFFMLGGALRAAGDARTPMILGIALTVLNLVLNIVFIRGLGPVPALGTKGAACLTLPVFLLMRPRRLSIWVLALLAVAYLTLSFVPWMAIFFTEAQHVWV